MAQGLDRRAQPVDNLRGREALNPVTRGVPSAGSVPTPRVPEATYGAQIAQSVNRFAGERLQQIQAARQERSMMDGQIAAMQGASFDSVEMEGDKWALEGWRMVSAQTMASGLLRAQEAEISAGAYEQDPDTYRQTLVNRIEAMTADIPDERTRMLAQDSLMEQMPGLVDAHMRQNLSFQEQQNFDALAASVDTISRDTHATGALIDFATGESEATAGLSIERRRSAVVQGVVNAFTNNNPAAFGHLEAAGFFTTENLTASQLQEVRTAQRQYEARFAEVVNVEHLQATRELDDRIANGLDPLVAVEELAAINARYGLRTGAVDAGQIYDRARAGVEFAEGTRGLNIQALGLQGDYDGQARLILDTILSQDEVTGGAEALYHMTEGQLAARLESHNGNLDGLLNEIWTRRNPNESEGIQPVMGATAIDPNNRSEWLRENTAGATRNNPLHNRLVTALGNVLPAMGLRFEVNSGGQGPVGSGDARTGGPRHDHGLAADGVLYLGDTMLDHSNPEHVPIFQEVVRRLRGQGLTGFGAGMGDGSYMGNNHIHVGYGADAVWSSVTSGAPVVGWLEEAFSAGPLGNADRNTFIASGTRHFSDNRPDPEAERLMAERNLERARERAGIATLEAITPELARIDTMYSEGVEGYTREIWQEDRDALFEHYNYALTEGRLNEERGIMRNRIATQIQEVEEVQGREAAVQLTALLAEAEETRDVRLENFRNGISDEGVTEQSIWDDYMTQTIDSFSASGAPMDMDVVTQALDESVRGTIQAVARADEHARNMATLRHAENAGTLSTAPQHIQQMGLDGNAAEIQQQSENVRAANPDIPPSVIGAMERQARVEYVTRNGIVDAEVQQMVNLAASGQAWIGPDGQPNPATVAGLHAFTSILAEDRALAFQYVSDPEARGRMMAAARMVETEFPNRAVFTDVDFNTTELDSQGRTRFVDPVANYFHTAVQQVGLSIGSASPDETAERVDIARERLANGNLFNTFLGGMGVRDASDYLMPDGSGQTINRILGRGATDFGDVNAAGRIDRQAINSQVAAAVEREIETVMPYMPGVSTETAVTHAFDYVLRRGAVMGSSFVQPPSGHPSITAQMFPGQQVQNTLAVNTAIGQWMTNQEVQDANPGALGDIPNSIFWNGVPEYTVQYFNGQYRATIPGHGTVVLPLREIGELYNSNR